MPQLSDTTHVLKKRNEWNDSVLRLYNPMVSSEITSENMTSVFNKPFHVILTCQSGSYYNVNDGSVSHDSVTVSQRASH